MFEIFKDGGTIREFINAVERMAKKKSKSFKGTQDNIDNQINTYKGDFLEVLSELFFDTFSMDEAIGLTNYEPIPIEQDYGVDAIGFNPVGDKVAVQVKYRANVLDVIEYSDIAKTYTSACEDLMMDLSKPNTIYLFTTSKGANYVTEQRFQRRKQLLVINREIIKTKIDNNIPFWKNAYQRIIESIEE